MIMMRMMMMGSESYTIGVGYVNSGENGKQEKISSDNFSD